MTNNDQGRVDRIWQRLREGDYRPGDIVWLLERLRKAEWRAENAERKTTEHDCLARLAAITENAAWPLSLLSWLIRQELGEPVTVWQPSAPAPRVGPQHDDSHLTGGNCWCNCPACTSNDGSARCICPDCNGASCGHEDRTAVRS